MVSTILVELVKAAVNAHQNFLQLHTVPHQMDAFSVLKTRIVQAQHQFVKPRQELVLHVMLTKIVRLLLLQVVLAIFVKLA